MKFQFLLLAIGPLALAPAQEAPKPAPAPAQDAPATGKIPPPQEAPALPAPPPAESPARAIPLAEPSLLPNPGVPSPPASATKPKPVPAPPTPRRSSVTQRPPATAAELDLRIRYRKARTIAEADRTVSAAWDESRHARTDLAKRKALKRYYDALLSKMMTLDPGLAPLIAERRKYESIALEQLKIAPTGSLE